MELFNCLDNNEKVIASIQDPERPGGISKESINDIHTHLQSSRIWKLKTKWMTEVEYTIPHPRGDVSAFDTNSDGDAKLSRKNIVSSFSASCEDNLVRFERIKEEPSDSMDFNTTRFSSVKIMNAKRFYYETERSCWVFRLVVSWEGDTKSEAERSPKKYFAYIETNGVSKASSNPMYTAASFLEKIIDVISVGRDRQMLTLKD